MMLITRNDPRYEHCHEEPRVASEAHARGIVGIHTRIGCTIDNCLRLRTARLYLAACR